MNVELAMATLGDARAHAEMFNMNVWWAGGEFSKNAPDTVPPCGTTACFAGFASLRVAPVGSKIKSGGFIEFPDGTLRHVENYAIEALDITTGQAWSLFYLDTIDQVEVAVNYLAGHPEATEEELDQAAGVTHPGEDDE